VVAVAPPIPSGDPELVGRWSIISVHIAGRSYAEVFAGKECIFRKTTFTLETEDPDPYRVRQGKGKNEIDFGVADGGWVKGNTVE
jgi:hypothetical protein